MVSLQVQLSSSLRNYKPAKNGRLWLIVMVLVSVMGLALVADAASDNHTINSRAMTVFREPNGWFLDAMKVFFNDIDWDTVAKAREQVEKFIRKAEKVITLFRSKFANKDPTKQEATTPESAGPASSTTNRSWWGSWSRPKDQQDIDPSNLKAMLEKAACFVGYMRILNFSGQALADLDASKVVSNLFSASKMNGSSPMSWLG